MPVLAGFVGLVEEALPLRDGLQFRVVLQEACASQSGFGGFTSC